MIDVFSVKTNDWGHHVVKLSTVARSALVDTEKSRRYREIENGEAAHTPTLLSACRFDSESRRQLLVQFTGYITSTTRGCIHSPAKAKSTTTGFALYIRSLAWRLGDGSSDRVEIALQIRAHIKTLPLEYCNGSSATSRPSSTCDFALCSRRLLEVSDAKIVRPIATGLGNPELSSMLRLLEQDSPIHLFCAFCEKLHRTERPASVRVIPWFWGSLYHLAAHRFPKRLSAGFFLYFSPWLSFHCT